MLAEIDEGLALIDQRFTELATNGDERANHFLEFADPRAQRARQPRGPGRRAGRRHRRARRAHRAAQASTAAARSATIDQRSAKPGRRRPARRPRTVQPEIDWIRDAAVEASERHRLTGGQHRRPAGPACGPARDRRRRRRRRAVEADRADRVDQPGPGARRQALTRRDRPGAGRRAGPGQGSRGPCRRARARSDRGGHPGKRRQTVGQGRARRSKGSSARSSRSGCAGSRRCRARGRGRARRLGPADPADAQRSARPRARSKRISSRPATDQREKDSEAFARRVALLIEFDAFGGDRRRQDPVRRDRRQGLGFATSRAIAGSSPAARCG